MVGQKDSFKRLLWDLRVRAGFLGGWGSKNTQAPNAGRATGKYKPFGYLKVKVLVLYKD